jgi:hypothetical protein
VRAGSGTFTGKFLAVALFHVHSGFDSDDRLEGGRFSRKSR